MDMAGKITIMSKIKQLLQLHREGASNRSIARELGIYKPQPIWMSNSMILRNESLIFRTPDVGLRQEF
jgi:hypothetical protein